MMRENLFLGGCPVVRPEGIYLNGRKVISLGLQGIGLGDVGDLFAYRQEWEPFIRAHLDLWRDMNNRFEQTEATGFLNNPLKKPCPPGIVTDNQIPEMQWGGGKAWCASLSLTRMMVSTIDPRGILPRWNAWADKSSAQILAGAPEMLKWLQDVVVNVGGPDKDRLVQIAKTWDIEITLPPIPTFSTQQDVIARIEGAYTTTKGILQILGYGAGETIKGAGDAAQAVAQGLTDSAKALPKAINWALVAGAVAVAVVGGALIIYYVPRRPSTPTLPP